MTTDDLSPPSNCGSSAVGRAETISEGDAPDAYPSLSLVPEVAAEPIAIMVPEAHLSTDGGTTWHYLHPAVDALLCTRSTGDLDAVYSGSAPVNCPDCMAVIDTTRATLAYGQVDPPTFRVFAGAYLLAAHLVDPEPDPDGD